MVCRTTASSLLSPSTTLSSSFFVEKQHIFRFCCDDANNDNEEGLWWKAPIDTNTQSSKILTKDPWFAMVDRSFANNFRLVKYYQIVVTPPFFLSSSSEANFSPPTEIYQSFHHFEIQLSMMRYSHHVRGFKTKDCSISQKSRKFLLRRVKHAPTVLPAPKRKEVYHFD